MWSALNTQQQYLLGPGWNIPILAILQSPNGRFCFRPTREPGTLIFPKHLHGAICPQGEYPVCVPRTAQEPLCKCTHHWQQQSQAKWTPAAQQPAFKKQSTGIFPVDICYQSTWRQRQHSTLRHVNGTLWKGKAKCLLWITALKLPVLISSLFNWFHFELRKLEGWGTTHTRNTRVQWIPKK